MASLAEHVCIWLEPMCQKDAPDGRLWSSERIDDCDETGCESKAVRFVRGDIADYMLAALKEIAQINDVRSLNYESMSSLTVARAAIAKAEGK